MKIRITEEQKKFLLKEYYDEKLSDDAKRHTKVYHGRNIIWYGDPEQMIVVHKSDVDGMFGNIYNPEKIEFLVNMIRDAEDKVELSCSYATGELMILTDAVEEQIAKATDYFHINYDGKSEAASTGDSELDEYIGTEDIEEYFSLHAISDEVIAFMGKQKTRLAFGNTTLESLQSWFNHFDKDFDDEEAIEEYLDLEMRLAQAVDNGDGDLGDFRVTLRDAHHRITAAIKSGEDYVCVNLDIDDIRTFKGRYQKV